MTVPDKSKNEEPKRNPAFIREKIVKKPVSLKERIYRVVSLVLLAALLGAAAAASFVLVRFRMEQVLYPSEPEEQVVIPKDTDPRETEAPVAETESAAQTETETSSEDLDELIQSAVNEKKLEIEDYKRLSALAANVWKEAQRSFVTVTAVRQQVDVFDNVYENEGQTSGIILEMSSRNVLILTRYDEIQDTDELEVTFINGIKAQAEIRATDSQTGIAVLDVAVSQLGEANLELITPITLGNSYALSVGSPVIAAGDPYGIVGSMSAGSVVYVGTESYGADTDIRIVYTNLGLPADAGGFLLNMDGEVIGIFTEAYSSSDGSLTPAVGISNIKGIIEHLCNGRSIAYMGIEGQAVTSEISENYDLPIGVYVTEAVTGSPAYQAGIQSGDVITRLGETSVSSMRDIHEALLLLEPGTEIQVTVSRNGMEGSRELTFTIQLESR